MKLSKNVGAEGGGNSGIKEDGLECARPVCEQESELGTLSAYHLEVGRDRERKKEERGTLTLLTIRE